jgi:hypothetical protein
MASIAGSRGWVLVWTILHVDAFSYLFCRQQASQEVIGFSHSVCHLSIEAHSPDYNAHTPGFQE